jgi:hypothetical protein
MEEVIKRKRGRPRKNSIPVITTSKRPRGRPRKIVVEAPIVPVNVPRKQSKAAAASPVRLGVEYCSEVLKTDRNGQPALTRNAKYINGKIVREMTYDYKKDEANYKLKEAV